jgi:outer membrane lipoprotein-sorting protein
MMTTRLLTAILLAVLAPATPADADEQAPAKPEDPALAARLEDIDARAAKIKDFTSEFRQEKFTALLKKPLVSSGRIRVSGTVIRWDTRKPDPAVLYSDGRDVRMYYPGQKLLEIYTIDQRLGDLAASPLPRLGTLRAHFTLERGDGKAFSPPKGRQTLALRLVPREQSLREHVEHVDVLLDIEAAHILELEITDADGDRTHVTFNQVRLDTGVKPEDLALSVPADTTVSRPLDVKDASGGK